MTAISFVHGSVIFLVIGHRLQVESLNFYESHSYDVIVERDLRIIPQYLSCRCLLIIESHDTSVTLFFLERKPSTIDVIGKDWTKNADTKKRFVD